ncbi:MAG: hypothetical protein ACOH13_14215 [Flavobacteriales bacterium]
MFEQRGVKIPSSRDKVDILDKWYEEARTLSSWLHPKGAMFDRQHVDHVFTFLRGYFPAKFFLHQFGLDQKIADVHILKRLLLNVGVPQCFAALLETADILEYAEQHFPALALKFRQEQRNATNFSATLYEAKIAMVLMNSDMHYENDALIKGTRLDGLLTFQGEPFIVECKKLTVPKQPDFDCLRRAMDQLIERPIASRSIHGYKLVVAIGRPAQTDAIHHLTMLQGQLGKRCQEMDPKVMESISCNSGAVTLTLIPHGCLDPGQITDDETLVASLDMSAVESVRELNSRYVAGSMHMSYSDGDVLEKIRSTIKAAKRQHRGKGRRMIIFLDSQEFPDLEQAILCNSNVLDQLESTLKLSRSLNGCLLVVTRRRYSAGQRSITVNYYCRKMDQPLGRAIVDAFAVSAVGATRDSSTTLYRRGNVR